MSFSDLVTGGAACGPTNPLQNLGKRFGQDRSTQMDRFDGADQAGQASPSSSSFRTRHIASQQEQNPAFFHPQQFPQHAFDMHPLKGALPHAPPADLHNAWREQRGSSAGPASGPSQLEHFERTFRNNSPSFSVERQWMPEYASEAQQQQQTLQQHSDSQMTRSMPFHRMPYRPMQMVNGGMSQQMSMSSPLHVQTQTQTMQSDVNQSAAEWDTAFTAIEHSQQPATNFNQQEREESRPLTSNDDADELAKTAGRLVSTVEHETSDKFKQSNFLNLMRKIRDRQAGIQGTDIVDNPEASTVDKGKGKAAEAPTSQIEATRLRNGADSINNTRFVQQEDTQDRQLMNDLWAEEDARSEAIERAKREAAGRSFVGDGGDVERLRKEDDFEYQKYQKIFGAHLGPAAAGLRNTKASSMEEDLVDELQNQDFVGRNWQGTAGRGVSGMQSNEWSHLQKDWDAWQATSTGLEQITEPPKSAARAPTYRFHAYNPYVGSQRLSHSTNIPPDMQSVLESEAAVQQDPNDAGAWVQLGLKQQENEREGLAIAALHRAIQLDPTMREAWLGLAVSYTNESDRSAALEAVERWVDATPVYRAIVNQYRKENGQSNATANASERHEQITNLLISLARHGNGGGQIDADVQVALGVLFNASEDYDKAVDCFTTALQVRPNDWLMYNRLGATLSNSGRSSEALQYYQQALDLKPGFVRCHFNMSISCLNLQMHREAASHIYTALTLQSESIDLQNGMDIGDAENEGVGGSSVTSSSLWETLRVSCELMDRPDLAQYASDRNLDRIDPSEFWSVAGTDGDGLVHSS